MRASNLRGVPRFFFFSVGIFFLFDVAVVFLSKVIYFRMPLAGWHRASKFEWHNKCPHFAALSVAGLLFFLTQSRRFIDIPRASFLDMGLILGAFESVHS